jgi:hypothetical protein
MAKPTYHSINVDGLDEAIEASASVGALIALQRRSVAPHV